MNIETNEFVLHLKRKYNYSRELTDFLQKALPAIIKYYGEARKAIIFDRLDSCEIHIQKEGEDIEKYLNEYFGVEEEFKPPTMLFSGFHHSRLIKTDNGIIGKNIVYLRTNYNGKYTPFNFNDEDSLSTLVHELCHVIKENDKLGFEDNLVIQKCGLMRFYNKYDEQSNRFVEINSERVGLEEALNGYDEEVIMSTILGRPYQTDGYKTMTKSMRSVLDNNPELAAVIINSQFSGGDEWINYLGKENSDFLTKQFQDLIEISYTAPATFWDHVKFIVEKSFTARYCIKLFSEKSKDPDASKKILDNAKNSQELSDIIEEETSSRIDKVLNLYAINEEMMNKLNDEQKAQKKEKLYRGFDEFVENNPEIGGRKK